MNIENVPIDSLIQYEFNSRNHGQEQVDLIAKSISEFGFVQPIIIDASNVIIAGHGRHLAALKLGLKETPCVRVNNLSDAQIKALRILDNKLQNDSTWSFDNLELELGFLEDEGFDLSSWGLDELKNLLSTDFQPATEEEQGKLDELDPKFVKCPSCDRVFDSRGKDVKA